MHSVREGSVLDMHLPSGETTSHSFTVGKGLLHVQLVVGTRPPRAQGKSFQMEIQYLSLSMACSDFGLAQAVDLEDVIRVEMSTPEGVLFSAEGLLLKKGSMLMCLRALFRLR